MKVLENKHFVAFFKKIAYKIITFCRVFLIDCKQYI